MDQNNKGEKQYSDAGLNEFFNGEGKNSDTIFHKLQKHEDLTADEQANLRKYIAFLDTYKGTEENPLPDSVIKQLRARAQDLLYHSRPNYLPEELRERAQYLINPYPEKQNQTDNMKEL
jgi:hypothetical protein